MSHNHVWQPTNDTVLVLREFSILYGGPQPATIAEHAHPEVQMTVRFPPSEAHPSPKALTHVNLYASSQPHSGGWGQGWRVVVFHFSPQMLEETAEELFPGASFEIVPFESHRESVLEEMARIMLHEFDTPDSMSRFYAESVGRVVAGQILRTHSETRPAVKPSAALSTNELLTLRRFIDERMEAGFSVVELARVIGLGPQRFAQKLRLATGLSPWGYVQARRITRASSMLRTGRTPIVAISEMLGFASQSHLTTVFRKALGITPNAYRNLFR